MIDNRLRYKAGAASVCFTPDEPFWLAGYAVRTAPARGKISDLFVSALALEDETRQRFVIASAEIIVVNAEISNRVAAIVQTRHGLSRHQLLLVATPTEALPCWEAQAISRAGFCAETEGRGHQIADVASP